jgi:hypothetical protein
MGKRRRVLRAGRFYRLYFQMKGIFDTKNADRLLRPAGIRAPRVIDCLRQVFQQCDDSDWGNRPHRLIDPCSITSASCATAR